MKMSQPKSFIGLGFRSLEDLIWLYLLNNVVEHPNNLASKVLKSKYYYIVLLGC